MSLPFGPQLIGETEKALRALLARFLEGTGLTEPHWVTLRLAQQAEGTVPDADALTALVLGRTRLGDAAGAVRDLAEAGLLDGARPTGRGRAAVAQVESRIAAGTAALWRDLPPADVEAATRVLHQVLDRAVAALGAPLVTDP